MVLVTRPHRHTRSSSASLAHAQLPATRQFTSTMHAAIMQRHDMSQGLTLGSTQGSSRAQLPAGGAWYAPYPRKSAVTCEEAACREGCAWIALMPILGTEEGRHRVEGCGGRADAVVDHHMHLPPPPAARKRMGRGWKV